MITLNAARRTLLLSAIAASTLTAYMTAAAPAAAAVWDAMHTTRKVEKMKGRKDKVGEFEYVVTVYKLDDGGFKDGDFYIIEQSIEGALQKSKYKKKENRCGWAMDYVKIGFDVSGKGLVIHDYSPETYKGSKSYSKSLSWKQGAGAPQIEAGYSTSTTVPDEGITVRRNISGGTITWNANLRDCKNHGDFFKDFGNWHIEGASLLARTTYKLSTTVMIQVDEGEKFEFSNRVGGARTSVGVKRYDVKGDVKKRKTENQILRTFNCHRGVCSSSVR